MHSAGVALRRRKATSNVIIEHINAEKAAAVKIQASLVGYAVRKEAKDEEAYAVHSSVLRLQAYFTGQFAKKAIKSYYMPMMQSYATSVIQALIVGHISRSMVKEHAEEMRIRHIELIAISKFETAATTVQAFLTGHEVRRIVNALRITLHTEATARLKGLQKGNAVRVKISELREIMKEASALKVESYKQSHDSTWTDAARALTAYVNGHAIRLRYPRWIYLYREFGATVIQARPTAAHARQMVEEGLIELYANSAKTLQGILTL